MHVVLVGGSPSHAGGIEAFCARAKEALEKTGHHRVSQIYADTAYLNIQRLPDLLRGLIAIARYRKHKPECLWLQYGNLPDLAYLVMAKLLGYRVMVTPHLGSNWRSQLNPFFRWLSCSVLRLANRIALISKTQELEISLPTTVPRSPIRNFLPAIIWQSQLPDQRIATSPSFQLLHSCRLSAGKGTFLVVDACALLMQRGIPFVCRISGGADPVTMSQLNDLIRAHKLEDSVFLLGRVSDDELTHLFETSDVLVHPSMIDSYPLVVLESISFCAFPICVNLAGAAHMIETYTGHIVGRSHTAEEIADFLTQQSPQTLWHLGRAAAEKVRYDYNWEKCVLLLEAALEATSKESKRAIIMDPAQ